MSEKENEKKRIAVKQTDLNCSTEFELIKLQFKGLHQYETYIYLLFLFIFSLILRKKIFQKNFKKNKNRFI